MTKLKKLLMAIVALGASAVMAETIYVAVANFDGYCTLQNGNMYWFTEDIDYTAVNCQSAMTVSDGGTGANLVLLDCATLPVDCSHIAKSDDSYAISDADG